MNFVISDIEIVVLTAVAVTACIGYIIKLVRK
ncbi:MAG: hypothetical protein RLY43_1829 [Bacteroidota bacterium]|jgi:hypothetical protein